MTKVSNSLLKDAGTTGKALITAASASAARSTLELGTAATTAASDYATANHTHSTAQISGLATVAISGSYNDLADKPTSSGVTFAKTKVVGVDAATIQGCIDLVTGATGLNQTQILIPPGVYAENLTLKPCVSLASTGGNNGQGSVVRINGYHTCQGSATAGDSILELNGLRFDTNTTNPVLTLTANGSTPFLVHMQDCMVGNSNSSTAVVGVQINANVSVRAANVRSIANSTAGAGGTHWDVNGGSLYLDRCSGEFGTGAILMRGTNGALTPYVECKWSNYITSGANAISITSATALLTMGWSAIQNLATTGNGISITAGSVAGVFNSTFTVVAGASNYVVTGDAGSVLYQQGNNYSNAPYATYETKINSLVTQFTYSPSRLNLGQTATPSAPNGGEAWLSSSNILTWYGHNSTQYAAAALSVANQFTAQQQLTSGLKLTSSSGPTITAGTNTPEGAITAPVGSLFLRTNGAANTTLYVKQTGSGNTGWTATAPAAITQLTGDVTTSTGGGSQAATLATLAGLTSGQYGSASSVAQVTVNAKGLTTLATSVPIAITTAQVTGLSATALGAITQLTGDVTTSTGGGSQAATLKTLSGLTSGQYGSAASVAQMTVNEKGLTTAASSIPIAITTAQITGLNAAAVQALALTGGTVSGSLSVLTTGSVASLTATQSATGTGSGLTVDINNTSSTAAAVRITNQGLGATLLVEDSPNPDATPFIITTLGNVGIGTLAPTAKVDIAAGDYSSNQNFGLQISTFNHEWVSALKLKSDTFGQSRLAFEVPLNPTGGVLEAMSIDGQHGNVRIGQGANFAPAIAPKLYAIASTAYAALKAEQLSTGPTIEILNTTAATTDCVTITNLGSGNSLVVNDDTVPDSTRFTISAGGRVGIGTTPDATVALTLDSTGIKFSDGSTQVGGFFTGLATYDAPSLAAGASTTTTVTCTGALTSHFAQATLSSNTGLTINAFVSAANTVTVQLRNDTASTIDLASGTLKVRASQ
jgi:hypothetical protein